MAFPDDKDAARRERPRIPAWFAAEVVAGEGVYLVGERSEGLLGGEVNVALAPFLDGRRSTDEIVDALDGVVDATAVYYAVAMARRDGYVVCDPPSGRSDDGFWGALGMVPGQVAGALGATRVELSSLGGVDTAGARRALEEMGLVVGSDATGAGSTGPDTAGAGSVLDVVVVDDYLNAGLAAVNADHLRRCAPWMPAKLVGTVLWLGPVIEPGKSACWACAAQRIGANREIASYLRWRRGADRFPTLPAVANAARAGIGARLLALLVAHRAVGVAGAGSRLVTFDTLTFEVRQHDVVHRPQCEACGDPGLAQSSQPVTLRPRRKIANADGSRSVLAEETFERYRHHISPVVGAVTELARMSDPGDPTMHVYFAGHNFAVRSSSLRYLREGLRSKSSGKGTTDGQARASAVGEALERYSGIFHGDERRRVAAWSQLGSDAVHPNDVMMFSDRQYAERDRWLARNSRFAVVPLPFDGDDPVEWTPLWSLTEQRWRCLPTGFLYYGYPHRSDQLYYWADSNGNAAGNVLEEAILQGFLELVERDAVCIWWYNRLRRPALDLASFSDPWVDAVTERYERLCRPVWVLDVTSDLGIPTFVALSARLDKPVEDILIACGAHLDPRIALHRALGELNQFLPAVLPMQADGSGEYRFPDPDCQAWWSGATRADQPYLVPDPTCPPSTAQRFSCPVSDDVADDVAFCRQVVESRGYEMLVLDQTRPDIGLPVVKVVVPGLRHFWARLGPGRLYDVPVAQGWLPTPRDEAELDPIPPFPLGCCGGAPRIPHSGARPSRWVRAARVRRGAETGTARSATVTGRVPGRRRRRGGGGRGRGGGRLPGAGGEPRGPLRAPARRSGRAVGRPEPGGPQDRVFAEQGPLHLAALYYTLVCLQRIGAVGYDLRTEGEVVLRVVPAAGTRVFSVPALDGDRPLALSRYVSLRRLDDRLVAEVAPSRTRVVLEDAAAGQLVGRLARPARLPELVGLLGDRRHGRAGSAGAARMAAAVAYLVGAGVLVDAGEDAGAELEVWEPQDLAFHRRSRRGGHLEAVGATYRLYGRQEPEPAVAPVGDGLRVGLAVPDRAAIAARDAPLFEVMERRRSLRSYGPAPVTVEDLGQLLYRVARVRGVHPRDPSAGRLYEVADRPYPSGGGVHELELYLVVGACEGLAPGAYHYEAGIHALTTMAATPQQVSLLLADAALATAGQADPQILLSVTSRFKRLAWKYSGIAYATTLKNVGVLYQSLYLVATAMGLAPCALGSGDSVLTASVLGLDELVECPVGEFLIGPGPGDAVVAGAGRGDGAVPAGGSGGEPGDGR